MIAIIVPSEQFVSEFRSLQQPAWGISTESMCTSTGFEQAVLHSLQAVGRRHNLRSYEVGSRWLSHGMRCLPNVLHAVKDFP